MNISRFQIRLAGLALLLLIALAGRVHASSSPSSDLQNLLSEAESVDNQLAGINLSTSNLCCTLLSAEQSARALLNSMEILDAGLSPPLSLDVASLQALDDIGETIACMAARSTALSLDLTMLNATTEMSARPEYPGSQRQCSGDADKCYHTFQFHRSKKMGGYCR